MSVTTPLGKVCLTPKGTWASTTSYAFLDLVFSDRNTYLAKRDVPAGTALSNTTYWQLIAGVGKSAYEGAVEEGYEGTEEEFNIDNAENSLTTAEFNTLKQKLNIN